MLVQLIEPEVKAAPILIGTLVWIAMQVTEVLHEHKRWVLLLAAELCILRNFTQH